MLGAGHTQQEAVADRETPVVTPYGLIRAELEVMRDTNEAIRKRLLLLTVGVILVALGEIVLILELAFR